MSILSLLLKDTLFFSFVNTIDPVRMSLFNNIFDRTNAKISDTVTKQIVNYPTAWIRSAVIFSILHGMIGFIAKWAKLSHLFFKFLQKYDTEFKLIIIWQISSLFFIYVLNRSFLFYLPGVTQVLYMEFLQPLPKPLGPPHSLSCFCTYWDSVP